MCGPVFAPCPRQFSSARCPCRADECVRRYAIKKNGQGLICHWPLCLLTDARFYRPLSRFSSSFGGGWCLGGLACLAGLDAFSGCGAGLGSPVALFSRAGSLPLFAGGVNRSPKIARAGAKRLFVNRQRRRADADRNADADLRGRWRRKGCGNDQQQKCER